MAPPSQGVSHKGFIMSCHTEWLKHISYIPPLSDGLVGSWDAAWKKIGSLSPLQWMYLIPWSYALPSPGSFALSKHSCTFIEMHWSNLTAQVNEEKIWIAESPPKIDEHLKLVMSLCSGWPLLHRVGRICVICVTRALFQLHTSDGYHHCSGKTPSKKVIHKMPQILNSGKWDKKYKP